MTQKIFILLVIVALMPLFYWLGYTAVYITLCKLFGKIVIYKEEVDGDLVTKKVRVKND